MLVIVGLWEERMRGLSDNEKAWWDQWGFVLVGLTGY